MTPKARLSSAIDLLCAIENHPRRPADATANQFFRDRRFIGGGDRRAISAIVWDVLRKWKRLHWHLAPIDGGASPRLLCAASLIFSGEAVADVARLFDGDRFAQSPLSTREARGLEALAGRTLDDDAMPQDVRLEYPKFLEATLVARFGDRLEEEMRAMDAPAPLDLRVNLLKSDRASARKNLADEQIHVTETPLSPWGLRAPSRLSVTATAAFKDGLVEIHDEGSQLIAACVDPQPGERIVDFCAGAGGKTLALAMLMENRGHITACDVSAPRLEGAVKRLRRAGVHNVERHVFTSGDKWVKRREGRFDRVLVDAPCSGSGTWRRNPDARIHLSENDIEELVAKQAQILDTAARLVRPGGRLVYATCSLLPAENEDQIAAFCQRNESFSLIAPEATHLPPVLRGETQFSLTPAANHTDGFFAATLVRKDA